MTPLEISISLLGGLLAGAILSILLNKYARTNLLAESIPIKTEKNSNQINEKFEIEQARMKYKTLKLEKELHTDALSRVFQAEGEGRITKKERDVLSQRYREQIKTLDNKLQDSELILEASELENLRGELNNLFTQKLSQIERRLNELSKKLENVDTFSKIKPDSIPNYIEEINKPDSQPEQIKPKIKIAQKNTISVDSKKLIKKETFESKKTSSNEVIDPEKTTIKISKDVPMADKKIKEIRDDVFDALDRLEQIDVDES